MDDDLEQFDNRTFVMQERAASMRLRDYVSHVESTLENEAWTVTTRMDTIMLKRRLTEVSAYQVALNNSDTEMSTRAPESIQLTTSDLFSIPMLYMGKREANVK